jgi:hypothetical protein
LNIWSILKLVVFSVVFVVAITFLTVEPPKQINTKNTIELKDLPKEVYLVGSEDVPYNTSSIIKNKSIIFLGNTESIILAPTFAKLAQNISKDLVVVSNVSATPWFLKQYSEYEKNVKLSNNSTNAWIYDKDGSIRAFLNVPTANPLKFFIYEVVDNTIKLVYEDNIASKANNVAMSIEDQKKLLQKALVKLSK